MLTCFLGDSGTRGVVPRVQTTHRKIVCLTGMRIAHVVQHPSWPLSPLLRVGWFERTLKPLVSARDKGVRRASSNVGLTTPIRKQLLIR